MKMPIELTNEEQLEFQLAHPGKLPLTGAQFSPDEIYRYTLWRLWNTETKNLFGERELKLVAFVGLNPSTADAEKNDPTVTRCVAFAKRWGCDGMFMLNLFALRGTDPQCLRRGLMNDEDIVGRWNDAALTMVCTMAAVQYAVCCWGNHGSLKKRSRYVCKLLRDRGVPLKHFGMNRSGEPKHPLYLPHTNEIQEWGA